MNTTRAKRAHEQERQRIDCRYMVDDYGKKMRKRFI
jgi:hypothetical protein